MFEKLEDRHLMSGDPVADPIGVVDDQVASAVAGASALGVALPNDPHLPYQWHLFNTGALPVGDSALQDIYGVPGEDANVLGAWQLGYTGNGVVVAVVDSGVQLDHPDLAANISGTLGYDAILNLDRQDSVVTPGGLTPGQADQNFAANAHGTAVAGLIAAVGANGIGGAGVAYNSTIVPIQLTDGLLDIAGAEVINALQYENNLIDIYNHSWGPSDETRETGGPVGPSDQVLAALRNSANNGRDGLGNIHVWASGNGAGPSFASPLFLDIGTWDYAGYDGYVNSPYTIGVTGVDHDGLYVNVDGTYTAYPEASASVLVAAPTGSNVQEVGNTSIVGSGIWTTDFINPDFDPTDPIYDPSSPFYNPFFPIGEGYNGPSDGINEPFDLTFDTFADPSYTSRFNGTSASAPIASGVIALMLEANPNLSYRDVQNILVRSARQNAQFEDLSDGLGQGTYGVAESNTWTVNRNEFFHNGDMYDGLAYIQNQTVNLLELFDDPSSDVANDYIDSAIGSGHTIVYNPILDPASALLGGSFDQRNTILTNIQDPNLFANGAGFTVSLGRGLFGTGVGYGHGTVDAELAVKLASQYTDYLPDELVWTTAKQQPAALGIGVEEVGGNNATHLVMPGRLTSNNQISAVIPAFSETPDFPEANTFSFGTDFLPVIVPETLTTDPAEGFMSNMVVEWVELRLNVANGDLDEARITLVSPDGTHSELVNYYDLDGGTRSYQYNIAADLVGAPPGTTAAEDWTFSTNRHWGEKSENTIAIDPATGEPYLGAPERSWQLHFENFGGANSIIDYEVIFHGSPLDPETQRIQGFVGVDELRADIHDSDNDGDFEEVLQDGYFNFDRYIQVVQDVYNSNTLDPEDNNQLENAIFSRQNIPGINANNSTLAYYELEDPATPGATLPFLNSIASETLANGQLEFNRLGEVERDLDLDQEQFAENVSVQLFREYSDGAGGTIVDAAPYKTFVTGDDGNYYFDVIPPVDESAAVEGDVVAYVVSVVDGEGRGAALDDANVPEVDPMAPRYFLPKYQNQWRVTDDYFFAWDHVGRSPELATVLNLNTLEEENVVRIVDLTGADALLDSNGMLVSARVANLGAAFDDPFAPQTIGFYDNAGQMTQAYDGGGAPLLTDVNGDPAVIMEWDPSFTGFNAHQYVLLNVIPGDPNGGLTVTNEDGDITYTLNPDGTILATDDEGNATIITINGDGSHTEVAMDGETTEVDSLLEIYDENGELVTVEQDLGDNFYFVSRTNMRTDVLFTPQMHTFDLDVAGNSYTYNPATMYDIATDAAGTPVQYLDPFTQTPVADNVRGINFLLSDSSSAANGYTGRVYVDANGDAAYDPVDGDVAKTGAIVFADLNADGVLQQADEPSAVADGEGLYSLDLGALNGPQFVEIVVQQQPGFQVASPGDGSYLVFADGSGANGVSYDFAFEVGSGGGSGDPNDPATLMGLVFIDSNQNGERDALEAGLANQTVFLDDNGNGVLDSGETQTTTNAGGAYQFTDLAPGAVQVAIVVSLPYAQTSPFDDANSNGVLDPGEGSHTVDLLAGAVSNDVNFGVQDLAANDYGDLGMAGSNAYPTTIAQNGPSHKIVPGVYLGSTVDGEIDGQPTADATGDDVADNPDEDGIVIVDFGGDNLIAPGDVLTLDVTVAGIGFMLNAWFDFNGDGDFDDPGEQVYDNADLNPGTWRTGQTLDDNDQIALPQIVAPENTTTTAPIGARFRWGPGDLEATGHATAGEVEDYLFESDPNANQTNLVVGDYSGNGTVGAEDYQVWRSYYGRTGSGLAADGNGDGVVDAVDYVIWRANYVPASPVAESSAATRSGLSGQIPSSQYLATLGLEVVMQKVGAGNFARYVPVYRIIQAEQPGAAAVAESATSTDVGLLSLTGNSNAVAIILHGRPVLHSGLLDSGLDFLSASTREARADQLDLALAVLGHDETEEDAIKDVFTSHEEDEGDSDDALALALEEEFAEV